MSVYYIRSSDKVFALDSTAEVVISLDGKTSDYVVEDGSTVQDHYVNSNKVVTCSGKISSIKSTSSGNNLSPAEYMQGMEELKESRTPFTFIWHPLRPPLDNCVFTSLSITQNSETGYAGNCYSVSVDFTIKQIKFAEQADTTTVPALKFKDKVEGEKKGAGSGKNPKETNLEGTEGALATYWKNFTSLIPGG